MEKQRLRIFFLIVLFCVIVFLRAEATYAQTVPGAKSAPSGEDDYVLYLKNQKLHRMNLNTRISEKLSDITFFSNLHMTNSVNDQTSAFHIHYFDEDELKLYCGRDNDGYFSIDLKSGKKTPLSDASWQKKAGYIYFNKDQSTYYLKSDSLYRTDFKGADIVIATGVDRIIHVYEDGTCYYGKNRKKINLYDYAILRRANTGLAKPISFDVFLSDLYYYDGKISHLVKKETLVKGVSTEKKGIAFFSDFTFSSDVFDSVLLEKTYPYDYSNDNSNQNQTDKKLYDKALLNSMKMKMYFHTDSGIKQLSPVVSVASNREESIFEDEYKVMIDHELKYLYVPINQKRIIKLHALRPYVASIVCDIVKYNLKDDTCSVYANDVVMKLDQFSTGEIVTYKNANKYDNQFLDLYINNQFVASSTDTAYICNGKGFRRNEYYDKDLGVHLFFSHIEGYNFPYGTINIYDKGKIIMQQADLTVSLIGIIKSRRSKSIYYLGDVTANGWLYGTMYRYKIGGKIEVLDSKVDEIIAVYSR